MPLMFLESQVCRLGKIYIDAIIFTKLSLWADSVYYLPGSSICLCVCVCLYGKTSTSGGQNKFWSKVAVFILASDD